MSSCDCGNCTRRAQVMRWLKAGDRLFWCLMGSLGASLWVIWTTEDMALKLGALSISTFIGAGWRWTVEHALALMRAHIQWFDENKHRVHQS